MRFEIKAATGVTHLAIEGELDAVSVSELRPDLEKLVKGRPTVVEVDLSSLRMVDSSGIGALVSLYKRIRAQGGSVVIKGLRDQPLAIFRLLRLDRVMLGPPTPGVPLRRTSNPNPGTRYPAPEVPTPDISALDFASSRTISRWCAATPRNRDALRRTNCRS